jgi:hypothetical protein
VGGAARIHFFLCGAATGGATGLRLVGKGDGEMNELGREEIRSAVRMWSGALLWALFLWVLLAWALTGFSP